MPVVQGIPSLLQLVHDAEDDRAALEMGCAWLERHAGADRAAMVAAGDGRVLAKRGWTNTDLETGEAGRFLRAGSGPARAPSGLIAKAPVLSGGVPIGYVLARTRWDARTTLEEALLSVAAICAAPFRSRLDAVLLATESHTRVPELLGRSPAIAAVPREHRPRRLHIVRGAG